MTSICGYFSKDYKCLFWDDRTVFALDTYSDNILNPKAVRIGDSIVAVAGAPQLIRILQYDQESLSLDFGNQQNIYSSLSTLRKICREIAEDMDCNSESFSEEFFGSSLMVINSFGLYSISDLLTVVSHEKFWSIGTGSEFCLGVMEVLFREVPLKQVDDVLKSAILAASKYDPCTAPSVSGISM